MASKAVTAADTAETREEAAEAPLLELDRERDQEDGGARQGARLPDL